MHFLFYSECKEGERILDPSYCDEFPTGGSETACAYVMDELRKRGHQIELVNKLAEISGRTCDVFISLRETVCFVEALQGLKIPGRLKYLWCHDDVDVVLHFLDCFRNPESAAKIYRDLDGVMMLSHYHQSLWRSNLNLPDDKVFQTFNGIPLEKFSSPPAPFSARGHKCYYASSPERGLKLLLEIWPEILSNIGDAELYVLSSHPRYPGAPRTPLFQELYDKAISLEGAGVRFLSAVGQAKLREVAQQCRVLAYPCTFPEISCICAMEAMASGCVVVGSAMGALPETAWRNPLQPFDFEFKWINSWILDIMKVLTHDDYYIYHASRNIEVAKQMSWKQVVDGWMIRFIQDAAFKDISFV